MKSLIQYINEANGEEVYYVLLQDMNGKKLSVKAVARMKGLADSFKGKFEQFDKASVGIKFTDEDMAKRCGTRLNYDATNMPFFKGLTTATNQDQPRDKRHYLIDFKTF